jgi:hypothetical protein
MIRSLLVFAAALIVIAVGFGTALAADPATNGDKAVTTKPAPSNGCDFETTAAPHGYGGAGLKTTRHVGEGDTVANASTGITWICKNGKLVKAK